MNETITISTASHSYVAIVGRDLLASAGPLAADVIRPGRCAVITDTCVGPLYATALLDSLRSAGWDPLLIEVPAGEKSKCLAEAERCCEAMIAGGLDRHSAVFALGGGVVGDLAGFVAAIYFRGIPCVQLPTTVVAQVDSSVGGKTGVNSRLGKNLIGSFHQPSLVLADVTTLSTLPDREFKEGLAEVIKHAIIRDQGMLQLVKPTPDTATVSLIAANIRIKAAIVAEDERETGGHRALLNFGHTVGHAIENAAGYGHYLHGEAVGLGLLAALHLSVLQAELPESDRDRIEQLLESLGLPTRLPETLTEESLLAAMQTDKKFDRGRIRFVLTRHFGSAFVSDRITLEDIRRAIQFLRR